MTGHQSTMTAKTMKVILMKKILSAAKLAKTSVALIEAAKAFNVISSRRNERRKCISWPSAKKRSSVAIIMYLKSNNQRAAAASASQRAMKSQ
jgi:hypothetical protein